jgi:hypothetical protein
LPGLLTATHKEALGHEIPDSVSPDTRVTVQADGPPVGLVVVTTLPLASTATHKEALGHDMLVRSSVPSTLATVQCDAPPVGSVEVTTLPELSTATQRETLGHETAVGTPPVANGGE